MKAVSLTFSDENMSAVVMYRPVLLLHERQTSKFPGSMLSCVNDMDFGLETEKAM